MPSVGCGTIAWSANLVTGRPNPDLLHLIRESSTREGGAFFDTGERYGSHAKTALGMGWGETESLLGDLLRKEEEGSSSISSTTVATKFTPSPWRTTARSVVQACLESRKRLKVDSIDLYQIQMPDIVKPLKSLGYDTSYDAVYWDGLAECYHRGLVENVGVSNYGPTLVARCQEHLAKRDVPLASNQIAYSLIGRRNGAQRTLDACNDLGVRTLAYYPFAMGLLTGKYTADMPELSAENAVVHTSSLIRSRRSDLERKDLQRYARGDGKRIPAGGVGPLLRTMERIARRRDKTVAQVALNYIVCKGAVPIPGARTAAQYKDNMGALQWRLTEDEVCEMEYVADNLGFTFDGAGFKRSNGEVIVEKMHFWLLCYVVMM